MITAEEILRKNIITLRENRNWSQAELARRLKMNNTILNKIETGNRKVSSFELDQIAEIFGVSTDFLLGRKEKKKDEIDSILDTAMAKDGKPLSENDREVIRSMVEAYLKNKK